MSFSDWHKSIEGREDYTADTSDIIEELMDRREMRATPDFLDLKMHGGVPVFVYGTLKSGGRLSSYMKGAPFLGDAVSTLCGHRMAICSADFPVLFDAKGSKAHVHGEVYICDAKRVMMLDRVESNGVMYDRKKMTVTLLDQFSKVGGGIRPIIQAFAYVGVDSYWHGDNDLKFIETKPGYKQRPTLVFDQRKFNDKIPF